MPSTSKAQARFMGACSHGAGYASCPPAKVAQEFNRADAAQGTRGLPARKNKSKLSAAIHKAMEKHKVV